MHILKAMYHLRIYVSNMLEGKKKNFVNSISRFLCSYNICLSHFPRMLKSTQYAVWDQNKTAEQTYWGEVKKNNNNSTLIKQSNVWEGFKLTLFMLMSLRMWQNCYKMSMCKSTKDFKKIKIWIFITIIYQYHVHNIHIILELKANLVQ